MSKKPSEGSKSPALTLAQQMQRGDLFSEKCPSREVLKHITSRWGVLILVALLEGTHRFSDLRRKIGGISEKMLAQTLQSLEADGLVNRKSFKVIPPHVEYSLTTLGQEAGQQVEALANWIEQNLLQIMKAQDSVKINDAG